MNEDKVSTSDLNGCSKITTSQWIPVGVTSETSNNSLLTILE